MTKKVAPVFKDAVANEDELTHNIAGLENPNYNSNTNVFSDEPATHNDVATPVFQYADKCKDETRRFSLESGRMTKLGSEKQRSTSISNGSGRRLSLGRKHSLPAATRRSSLPGASITQTTSASVSPASFVTVPLTSSGSAAVSPALSTPLQASNHEEECEIIQSAAELRNPAFKKALLRRRLLTLLFTFLALIVGIVVRLLVNVEGAEKGEGFNSTTTSYLYQEDY